MPLTSNSINLVSTKTNLSPQVTAIEASLRKASQAGLVLLLVFGLTIGAVYYYSVRERTVLENTRRDLRSQINAAKNKEGLLTSIKDRTKIVERAMSTQRPWAQMLDLVGTIAQPPFLTAVSVDDQGEIEVTLQGASIDDIVKPVETFIAYTREGKLISPRLTSIQLDQKGKVIVSVSFGIIF